MVASAVVNGNTAAQAIVITVFVDAAVVIEGDVFSSFLIHSDIFDT